MKQLINKIKLALFGNSTYKASASQLNAIAELETYSDQQLDDLGLSRFNIREAVLFGRPNLDSRA